MLSAYYDAARHDQSLHASIALGMSEGQGWPQVHATFWYGICMAVIALIVVMVRENVRPKTRDSEDQSLSALAPIVIAWMTISGGLTWVNKLIFTPEDKGGLGFPFVALLMLWHMFLAVVFTNILRFVAPQLMPAAAKNEVSFATYVKNIAPVGICMAGSMILSNAAYIYLSVGYIQMVKSCTSGIVYMVAVLVGQEIFNIHCGCSLLLICGGVVAASLGELDFNTIGFVLQFSAVVAEAGRLVILKALVSSSGIKLDSISGLFYYAPTCFVAILATLLLQVEGAVPWGKVTALFPVLLASGLISLALQLTVLVFLKHASSTTYAVSGILKDVLLIASTSMYYAHPVTGIQVVGYCFSLMGLILFNRAKEAATLATLKAQEAKEKEPTLPTGKATA